MKNKALKIAGDIPSVRLCRFYAKPDYADQFVAGNLRFGWQKKYSAMEGDLREDATEGTASFTVDGNSPGEYFTLGSLGGWESYILCTSELRSAEQVKLLCRRFSNPQNMTGYCVEIKDIGQFTIDVAKSLRESPYWKAIDYIFWKKVEYTKFQNLISGPPDVELHSYQKPHNVSTIEFRNKVTGSTSTLTSTHMFMANNGELANQHYPIEEWTRAETHHDYTVEAEWRLIISIKPRFKVEELNIPLFVEKSERNSRICRCMKINPADLKNYTEAMIAALVPPSIYWIDTLQSFHKAGISKYASVEIVTL